MKSEHQIASVLGGDKVLHHKITGTLDFDRLIREGFPWEAGLRVKETLHLKDDEFAKLLGISVRTLSRRKTAARMPSVTSDRLYRIARIYTLAIEVLEDAEKAMHWLCREQIGLGGRIPLDMIRTEAGEREVENLLGRIEHGVLA